MAYNETLLTYIVNNAYTMQGVISIPGKEFKAGKDYYTLKYTCVCPTGTSIFEYHITTLNKKLPAVVIGGEANASSYGCPFSGSWGEMRTNLSLLTYDRSNNPIIQSVKIISSLGDNYLSYRGIGRNVINNGKFSEAGTSRITIEADFPIFAPTKVRQGSDTNYVQYFLPNDTNIRSYINEIMINDDYSNIDKAVNYINIVNSIPTDQTYFINSTLKVNGHVTNNKGYCFQILPDVKICLYQDDSATGDASPNLHLMISRYPCLVKRITEDDSHYTETSSPELDYWHSGYWRDLDTGVNYTGICSTNIPIFRGQQNAQKYLDGELSESDALNGGSFANKDSTIGDELTSSDIPTINLASSGVGCYIYALSEGEIKDLMANYLYVTDPTLTEQIQNGLWYWGNNPIDFMIDCYYVPFSITPFYDTVVANMKFGTYQFINSAFNAVKESNGNRLTLFNTTFEGVYGDWRDYTQFKYDLYLPFVGFFSLDTYKYLNHTVKCEMMFDLSTHNVRYYLFVDGIITDRVDGSVGVNIPLMSSDMVNKAKNDREAIRGYVDSSLGAINSVASIKPSIAGAVGNVINATRSLEDLYNKATQSVEGSFSSSMNIYDISYSYLRITEDQMIIPDKVHQLYNYPSYYMGAASTLSGYCEISDVRFKNFTGTIDEQTTLLIELTEGVIL